jgi:hypothetical protein
LCNRLREGVRVVGWVMELKRGVGGRGLVVLVLVVLVLVVLILDLIIIKDREP